MLSNMVDFKFLRFSECKREPSVVEVEETSQVEKDEVLLFPLILICCND